MDSSGSVIRSAKTKLTTPPKLMPPCHSAAASGTLPTEQTKLTIARNGPSTTFSRLDQNPCPVRNSELPERGRNQRGEEARDEEADHQFLAQHREVADRVSRRVAPTPS